MSDGKPLSEMSEKEINEWVAQQNAKMDRWEKIRAIHAQIQHNKEAAERRKDEEIVLVSSILLLAIAVFTIFYKNIPKIDNPIKYVIFGISASFVVMSIPIVYPVVFYDHHYKLLWIIVLQIVAYAMPLIFTIIYLRKSDKHHIATKIIFVILAVFFGWLIPLLLCILYILHHKDGIIKFFKSTAKFIAYPFVWLYIKLKQRRISSFLNPNKADSTESFRCIKITALVNSYRLRIRSQNPTETQIFLAGVIEDLGKHGFLSSNENEEDFYSKAMCYVELYLRTKEQFAASSEYEITQMAIYEFKQLYNLK